LVDIRCTTFATAALAEIADQNIEYKSLRSSRALRLVFIKVICRTYAIGVASPTELGEKC